MKKIVFFLLMLLTLQGVSAINLEIQQEIINDVVIRELDEPAVFILSIKNNGEGNTFRLYNLHGIEMFSQEEIYIGKGETKEIEITIHPRKDIDYGRRAYFNYFLMDSDNSQQEGSVLVKMSNLKDVFEIGVEEVDPDSHKVDVYIHNKFNFNFENVFVKFTSRFFNAEESFSLGANQRKDFLITLDRERYRELTAGFYTLKAEIFVEDASAVVESTITFKEKSLVTESKREFGAVIYTEIIETKNEGNTIAESTNSIRRNIISRLFTSLNPEPDNVERKGFFIEYEWIRQVRPGESLVITARTNWLFPFLFFALLATTLVFLHLFSKKEITVRKRVNFVRAKGGEFALKVSIYVQANKYVERVSVIDSLPPLVKIYERYGSEKPSRVDEKNRRIDWNFEKLEAGEIRMLTYVIYSKVGIMGKFALPATTAVYEKEEKIKEVRSNRAFFVAEQRRGEVEE